MAVVLHHLLETRWSPLEWDPDHRMTRSEVESVLEAAHWAPQASLLIANLCHRYVADTTWDYSEFAHYDLGQAVAHMTVQARSLGLQCRQFRAFDRERLAKAMTAPANWEVTSMIAIGRVPEGLTPRALTTSVGQPVDRDRRDLDDLQWRPGKET